MTDIYTQIEEYSKLSAGIDDVQAQKQALIDSVLTPEIRDQLAEIDAEFDPKVAKQPNYNPFTDLGGYGCRHQLRWISLALAKRMRPEIMQLFENN